MWRDKIQISREMWETGFKNLPKQTPSVLGPVRWHQHTDFCAPAHPPVGQKMSLVKHKIMTSANYTDGIGTGCRSHDKEMSAR